MKHRAATNKILAALPLGAWTSAHAAGQTPTLTPVSAAGGLMQSISGLAIVLAVIAGLYWLMTRLRRGATARTSLLKMISGMQVGAKERIVLVELGDSWLLLGVAPGQVNTLHSMPKMELPADSGIAPMKTFAQLLDSARGKNAR